MNRIVIKYESLLIPPMILDQRTQPKYMTPKKDNEKPFEKLSLSSKRAAETIVKNNHNRAVSVSKEVQINLAKQCAALSTRIFRRKSLRQWSMPPKTSILIPRCILTMNEYTDPLSNKEKIEVLKKSLKNECDKSGGPPKNILADKIEKDLEQLGEKYIMEKLQITEQIWTKYQSEKEAVETLRGTEMFHKIIEEINHRMQEETSLVCAEIENRREAEVKRLTSQLASNK